MSDKLPLSREEVISVIERKGAARRIPMAIHFWAHSPDFGDRQQKVQSLLDRYPMDFQRVYINIPPVYDAPPEDPTYRWVQKDNPSAGKDAGLDESSAISDWEQFDDFLAGLPSTESKHMIPEYGCQWNPEEDGRYRLGSWWFCLFERHWSLRGMTNALMDFYTDPESVHRLYRTLTDFYLRLIERAKTEGKLDGIFVSDDLGTQTGPFFSPEIFQEFFLPYYRELFAKAHSLDMHFWLHTCGNVELFMPDFIDAGLDVIHPIQKYTMSEPEIAQKYGDKITFWAGFDVQQTIPHGSPEDVRKEVRYLYDTFWRPEGGLMLTAGNGLTPDTPVDSLEALLDEAYHYGIAKAAGR